MEEEGNQKKGKRIQRDMEQRVRKRKKTGRHRENREETGLGLIGKRFGNLVVLRRSRSGRPGAWVAKCDCGKLALVYDYLLKSGHTKNCGCDPSMNGRESDALASTTQDPCTKNQTASLD